jgi:hypothetical protein
MAKLGNYCKAYPMEKFREYPGFPVSAPEPPAAEATDSPEPMDGSFAFLQEDFTVTADIFMDEDIIFSDVTPDWVEFCKTTLQFEVPDYAAAQAAEE